jgi:DNA repair exonuclease SbcCD ATPase subunit
MFSLLLTIAQDDESDQERQTRNNDSNERLQKATQKVTAELTSALEKLKTKEHLARSTAHKLQLKGQELAAALDSLENKELELRHAKHESDAQKQRFESTIEDLEGEIRRLHEIQAENQTHCAELSNTAENLQNELQQLRAETDEIKSRPQQHAEEQHNQGSVADRQKQLLELHASNEIPHAQADNVRELQDSNEALKAQLSQAQADHASLMTTLQGVSGMIEGALSLGSKTMMVTILQGVLGMLREVLNLGFRASNLDGGTKRARIKEEDDAQDNLAAPLPKRLRQAKHIDSRVGKIRGITALQTCNH